MATVSRALYFAKIDIKEAFYVISLPKAFHRMSTFKLGNQYFQFRRLPMDLYISPYLLQTALWALLGQLSHVWIHIDDILIWGMSYEEVKAKVELVIRELHRAGFRITNKKSRLQPLKTIKYCGIVFQTRKQRNFTAGKWVTLKEVLRIWNANNKRRTWRYLGFLVYILSAAGLSSASVKLINKSRQWWNFLWHIFSRLPRGWKDRWPRRINWACDAAQLDMAVVDDKGLLRWHARHSYHINVAEEIALFFAMTLAPNNSTIWTDSRVAVA